MPSASDDAGQIDNCVHDDVIKATGSSSLAKRPHSRL
jgi:hypothetical protein